MCDLCLRNPCVPGCPNYVERKSDVLCEICGEYILPGEEYVKNEKEEYIHVNCISQYNARLIINWFGYATEIMNE